MEEVTKSSSYSSSEVEERLGSATHSAHKRVDIDHQLRADLLQNCSRTSVEGFLDAFKIEGLEETREWRRFKNHLTVKQDNLIRAYLERYKNVRNEQQYYAIFAAIANRITQLFNEYCGGYVRRRIRFLGLGNQAVTGSPSYHCGEEVHGTGSGLKPDGMVILLDDNQARLVDETENSQINLENSSASMDLDDGLMLKEWDEKAQELNKSLTEGVRWKDCLLSVEFKKRSSTSLTTKSSKHSVTKPFTAPAKVPSHTSLKRVRDDDDDNERPRKTNKRARNPPSKTRVSKPHMQTADSVLQGDSVTLRNALSKELRSNEVQLASYALETMCALGNRAHTFGILLQDFSSTLWFYDRSGAIASAELDFNRDIVSLAKFTIAFSAMDDTRLGFIDVLQAPSNVKHGSKAALAPLDLIDFSVTCGDQKATFDQLLDRRFSFVGRGTLVHRGTMSNSRRKVAVKLSWQVCSRRPEWEIIQEALDGGCPERYIVEVIAHSVHCKLSEGFRGAIQGWSSTEMYEDRELRIIITELLEPVTNLSGLPDIKLFVWSTFHAIYYLDKAGIHHRDVSAGNLGYQQLDCGRRLIKFFDFDHARKHDQKQSSRHFTGTLPFLAIDLLLHNNAPYVVRFDYESMMWTSLWIVVCYEDGQDQYGAKDHPLIQWFNPQLPMDHLANNKLGFMSQFRFVLPSDPRLSRARDLFRPLVACFDDGYRKKETPLDETLGGFLTPKSLRNVLLEGKWGECDQCLLPTCEQCSLVDDGHLLVII
ncbi:hypothetical protein FRC02_009166 [Tulasnella sp. 418]|nr:hypothetical protein FRC02_009166 [Tulasnella sp. 418]